VSHAMAETLVKIRSQDDVVRVRQAVRAEATALGFSLVDLTKLVTAASELARNALVHGGGGEVRIERIADNGRAGLRAVFADDGPGIANLEEALRDGFSSGSGLGLGLGGARRLVSSFEIDSAPGAGTRVTIVKWK
jgi:serine/threonine-protein kinase RsbT